jgi:quercetin dioxygenase-like cupin family protein
MSDFTRRDVCRALPVLSLFSVLANGASAQVQSATTPAAGQLAGNPVGNALSTDFSHCKAFPFEQLPLRYSNGGAPTHDIARGTIPTGEVVELHETTVAPGKMPHAAHQHPHEEFILVREGTMDLIYDGESHLLGPGSVGYTAPNQMHGFKNAGSTPATYFIFSLSKKYS